MPNEPTLTRNSGGWNCLSPDGKIEVYGATRDLAIWNCGVAVGAQILAAEKLRADRLAESVEYALRVGYKAEDCGDHCSNACYWCELRAALALGGKEKL